jgi:valyl-tRNA synthetase
VEAAKARLYGDDPEARTAASQTLLHVLERMLALAHPVLPFVTEEIWSFLPGERDLLVASPMPQPDESSRDRALEARARQAMALVSEARRLAAEGGTVVAEIPADFLFTDLLSRVRGVHVRPAPDGSRGSLAVEEDVDATRAALHEQLRSAVSERDRARAKLANEGFTSRAPEVLVAAERDKAERFAAAADELEQRLHELDQRA